MPPAELLDLRPRRVGLRRGACAGPRFAQARENLKKIRALIRRIQNRGYATLGRIVAHLDRLAVGDEANAVIDALDAVNLMTVHAAKGWSFRSSSWSTWRGHRQPARPDSRRGGCRRRGPVGGRRATISPRPTTTTAREREETKRLLYVALTRARDRLYLGSVLKDGQVQPGRGSLAEVLPGSLLEAINAAAAQPGQPVRWRSHTLPVTGHD